ncbi:MAG: hypothetical protein LBN27_04965 [Prevotellaceae bacterium]|nr:hypothetical protein [Prevotellaceae bacterium]
MRKILLFIAAMFLMISCKSQEGISYLEKNFIFTIEFYPSFTEPCRIILQNDSNSKTAIVDLFYNAENLPYLKEKNNLIPQRTDILLIDDWYKKYMGDTVYFKHLETIQISNKEFQNFADSISKADLSKQKSLEKEGILDGITIFFSFKTDTVDNIFSFRCPAPKDTTEFAVIKALFDLLEESYKLETTNNYIENLKGYFDFGLCVKYIADDPFEYRFYSHLSSDEAEEFYTFMDNLPRDKPVIFDFSNFGGMGTMFYDDFEEFIEENPDVYWLVNDWTIKLANEMEVKQDRIFKSGDEILRILRK